MAVSAKWYGQAYLKAFNKEIDWDSDTIKVALFTTTYTPDQDTHVYFDVSCTSGQIANGNGYTTGGATLANKTIGYTGATNVTKFDADDVSWTSSSITAARYAVIYDDSPASNKPLLGYVDFGEDRTSSSGTLQITWDAAGILTITPA
jgi:hypothetical protein